MGSCVGCLQLLSVSLVLLAAAVMGVCAGTYEDRAVPTRIKALVGKDIERVAGGQHHTIFLRRDGVVYGCGSCKLGQVSKQPWQRQALYLRVVSINRFALTQLQRWCKLGSPQLPHKLAPPACKCVQTVKTSPACCCCAGVLHMPQVPGSLHRMSPDRTVPIPIKLHLPFQPSKRDRERQQREREHRNSGSNLAPVIEGPEQELAQLQLQQQQPPSQRPSATGSIQRQSSGGCSSATSSRSVGADPTSHAVLHSKCPVVHQIVAGGNSSMFLTRAPEEIPEVYSINLLAK